MLVAVKLECTCSSANIHSFQSCEVGISKPFWVLELLVLIDNTTLMTTPQERRKGQMILL